MHHVVRIAEKVFKVGDRRWRSKRSQIHFPAERYPSTYGRPSVVRPVEAWHGVEAHLFNCNCAVYDVYLWQFVSAVVVSSRVLVSGVVCSCVTSCYNFHCKATTCIWFIASFSFVYVIGRVMLRYLTDWDCCYMLLYITKLTQSNIISWCWTFKFFKMHELQYRKFLTFLIHFFTGLSVRLSASHSVSVCLWV